MFLELYKTVLLKRFTAVNFIHSLIKKKHMYLNDGALVTENLNPGVKALAKERPDVVKKILNK